MGEVIIVSIKVTISECPEEPFMLYTTATKEEVHNFIQAMRVLRQEINEDTLVSFIKTLKAGGSTNALAFTEEEYIAMPKSNSFLKLLEHGIDRHGLN